MVALKKDNVFNEMDDLIDSLSNEEMFNYCWSKKRKAFITVLQVNH
jgi:hypothetical protein